MHQQQQAKTSGVPLRIDLLSRPKFWWQQYKHEVKTMGRFTGNLSSCYSRYERAIKEFISLDDRLKIYLDEKARYLDYVQNFGPSWFGEEIQKELIRQVHAKENIVLNAKYKDLLVKEFFKRILEQGKEATDYLEIV